ncbi:Tudor/PWWP/MBT domain-containing protein [Actinidia rufa]|uniref:Tudor/PWWP/MBT domain-containing protein n=1 Tax=Actinidia rufa TaxID=165716 RepID=A0A7J0H923_9ERIC|nr:Tudor/PWWP/MBT domain-containing protein [Actinidia rufa]
MKRIFQVVHMREACGGTPVESVPTTGEPEPCTITSNDGRHCILEDVDGELEMEGFSGHLNDERPLFANGSIEFSPQQQGSEGILEAAQNSSEGFDLLIGGSPPLPLDSPPLIPPLPPSPPSPPPPPSSPSPPVLFLQGHIHFLYSL